MKENAWSINASHAKTLATSLSVARSKAALESLNTPAHWFTIGDATADAVGRFSFTDPDASRYPAHFYRFVKQ